jgi:hypothetical protein
MSPAQASAAQSMKWSDLTNERFDMLAARDAYAALAEPAETGDREPTFLDRMLRRVGRSPLSRVGAETAATKLVETLRKAGVLGADALAITTAREEDFHGELDADALRELLDTLAERHGDAHWANLRLTVSSALYMPTAITRVVHGVPFSIGSTPGLVREIAAARDAFGAHARSALDSMLARLDEAARCAEERHRILLLSR